MRSRRWRTGSLRLPGSMRRATVSYSIPARRQARQEARADSMTNTRAQQRPGGERQLTQDSADPASRALSPGDSDTQLKIVIPDDHSMVILLGSGDELLQVIERDFAADIHVRGNEITVTGPHAETALVARLFEELTKLASSGTELSVGVVEQTVSMLRKRPAARPD